MSRPAKAGLDKPVKEKALEGKAKKTAENTKATYKRQKKPRSPSHNYPPITQMYKLN
jgi:hypothetical protein